MLEKAAAAKEEVRDPMIIVIIANDLPMQAIACLQKQDTELKRIRDGLVATSKVLFSFKHSRN